MILYFRPRLERYEFLFGYPKARVGLEVESVQRNNILTMLQPVSIRHSFGGMLNLIIVENYVSLNQIKIALYALFLTNKYGLKLRKVSDAVKVTKLRLEYAETLLSRLNISVEVVGAEKIDHGGQYLIISNHRSIIDPLIVEIALKNKGINSLWVAKKELYNSFFFGTFTRNAGSILLDRDSKKMSLFFKKTKTNIAQGYSICIFPEGTRNKDDALLSEFKEGSQIIAMKNRLKILPVFIKTNANEVLKKSIQNNTNSFKVTIVIGDLIDYKDRSRTLEDSYKQRFNL